MSERSIVTVDTGIPKIIEALIKAAPGPLQVPLREALKKAAILNPDDPVFELVLVLELMGVYYQRIAGSVTKAGADIDAQNKAALASLDDRVRKLQGLAQIIQQATDRLDNAGQEIAERFPARAVVESILQKVDQQIQTLPLKEFEKKMTEARGTLHTSADKAENSATQIEAASGKMEAAAKTIAGLKLPRLSFWSFIIAMLLGVGVTFGGMWFWWAQDEVKVLRSYANVLYTHRFLEDRVWTGPNTIIVPVSELDGEPTTDGNGNLTITLKKRP